MNKIEKFFEAIDDIEISEDGSIIIQWKSNVAHYIPGHSITHSTGSNIQKGHQVHMNPELGRAIKEVDFKDLQQELDQAVLQAKQEAGLS